MFPQRISAHLLTFPLLVLLFVSISYWIRFRGQEKKGTGKQHIGYNKLFLTLMAIGYFGIWVVWLGGIFLLYLDQYYSVFDLQICLFMRTEIVQITGLIILYIGSLFFAWTIGFAGKSLRPSTSDVFSDHKLVQDGPLAVVRHPYYVSYVVMLVGLGFVLGIPYPFLLALCIVIGMGPMAEAEEKQLLALFGEEYQQYQQRVGRFFPKIFK